MYWLTVHLLYTKERFNMSSINKRSTSVVATLNFFTVSLLSSTVLDVMIVDPTSDCVVDQFLRDSRCWWINQMMPG